MVGVGVREKGWVGNGVRISSKIGVGDSVVGVAVVSASGFGSNNPMMANVPSARTMLSLMDISVNFSAVPGYISVPVQVTFVGKSFTC